MSSNNDQTSAISIQIALVVMGALFFATVALAVAGVASVLITAAAIAAWNRPKRFGPVVMTPHKAQSIVGNGLSTALGIPLGIMVVQYFNSVPIAWNILPTIGTASYTIVSLLVFRFGADFDENQEAEVAKPKHAIESKEHSQSHLHQPRFASWNDEGELK